MQQTLNMWKPCWPILAQHFGDLRMLDMGNDLKDDATERMLFHGASYGNANAIVPTLSRTNMTCKVPTAVLCLRRS